MPLLESSIFWLRAALLLYSIGLLHVLLTVLRRRVSLFSPGLASFCVGAVLHFVALTELTRHYTVIPLTNFHEILSATAFLNALVFLIVYWRYQFKGLALFQFPLVFFLTLVAATELPVGSWANRSVRDILLTTHILLILLGYAAMLLTAVASVIYLIQERNLKQKMRSTFFDRLPSLTALDEMVSRSMGWAFVFITLGVSIAVVWAFIELGTRWLASGQVIISLITWVFYLVMIVLRTNAGWRGRKAAVMVLTVLGCSALTWITHLGLPPLVGP